MCLYEIRKYAVRVRTSKGKTSLTHVARREKKNVESMVYAIGCIAHVDYSVLLTCENPNLVKREICRPKVTPKPGATP